MTMAKFLMAFVSVIGLFFCAQNSFAEEELAPGYGMCMENAVSTPDQIECITTAYQYWDKILNTNYKNAKKSCADTDHPKECASSLLTAERNWIKYRDEMAAVIMMLNGGGTLSRVAADLFIAEETKKQAKALSVE